MCVCCYKAHGNMFLSFDTEEHLLRRRPAGLLVEYASFMLWHCVAGQRGAQGMAQRRPLSGAGRVILHLIGVSATLATVCCKPLLGQLPGPVPHAHWSWC